jgi:L-asparaginase
MVATAGRVVRVIGTGGTIAMAGRHATPALDAAALVERAVAGGDAQLADLTIKTSNLLALPGAHLELSHALAIVESATSAADEGEGVVVTQGTDTLEEVAFLCDLLYGGDAPIVFTGAMKPSTAVGTDGAANVLDAITVASSPEALGLGVVVAFAGQIHAARCVQKVDSVAAGAFQSPHGEIGQVTENRVTLFARPERRPPIRSTRLDARVELVAAALGSDGVIIDSIVSGGVDGLVAVALGAGHFPPPMFSRLAAVADDVPVVAVVRPLRGSILHQTYGFTASERDLRRSEIIPAGLLSPAAARMKLIACLGASMAKGAIREAFAVDDG